MVATDVSRERPGQINESCNSYGQIESWIILKMCTLDVRQRDTQMIPHIVKESLKLYLKYTRMFAKKRCKGN